MISLLVIICSSWLLGKVSLRILGLQPSTLRESLLYSTGLGLGVWCFVLFALGHAALFYPFVLISMALAFAVPAPVLLWREIRRHPLRFPTLPPYATVLIVAIGLILSATFLCCFAPITGGIGNDELCTHLSIPHEWLRHHALALLPYSISYQAGNAHLLFLLVSCFDAQSGPRLVSWLCFVLCILAVYTLARAFMKREGALLAAAITAMNPLVFRAAMIAFVDLESSLFVVLPLCAFVMYKREKRIAWLGICGFCLAVGCGIKPTNILYSMAMILVAAAAIFLDSKSIAGTLRALVMLCTVTVVFAAPWPVRNLLITGSPTFPPPLALYHFGHGPKPLLCKKPPFTFEEIRGYYNYCLSRYGNYKRTVMAAVAFPWDITMHSDTFQIGDSIGTVLLSLLPLLLFCLPLPATLWFLIWFAVISGLGIFFVVLPEGRYYMTAFMALGVAAAYAATTLVVKNRVLKTAVFLTIGINILFSLSVAGRITASPIRTVFSAQARETLKRSGIPYYEAFEYLRRNRIDTVLVGAPDRIYYYLHGTYSVDTALYKANPCHDGRIVLDIDYSQERGRDPALLLGKRCTFGPLPDNTRLLFEGPDARIYAYTTTGEARKGQ